MKILLVEDHEDTATVLTNVLTRNHYVVNTTDNGTTALELLETYRYDLIILDIGLPDLDGLSMCRSLRSQGNSTPILMLTGNGGRIQGLEAGADDYVIKPFDISELLARIRALLRRGREALPDVLTWEKLALNPILGEVTYNGFLLHLTPKEYQLLELFLRNPLRLFSRTALLDRVWDVSEFPGERAVITQIKGLRKKLKSAGMAQDIIETVYGLGYRLRAAPPIEEEIDLVEKLQDLPQDLLQEAFDVFEATIRALTTPSLFEVPSGLELNLREQARSHAERLITTLASIGSREGAEVARQIEKLLQPPIGEPSETDRNLGAVLQGMVELLKQIVQPDSLPRAASASGGLPPADYNFPEQSPSPADPTPPAAQLAARLLLIAGDLDLIEQIRTEAIAWGLTVAVAIDIAGARDALRLNESIALRSPLPDVILIDFSDRRIIEDALALFAELSQSPLSIPVLVLSEQQELSHRIALARLKGHTFLQKPTSVYRIFQAIEAVISLTRDAEAKVMIVDSDPDVLEMMAALLTPWGLRVTTLSDPHQFWTVLEACAPNLLILSVELPNFSGLDLCQVVRSDFRWGGLPILCLTAHATAETVRQIYTVGADDYVSKPLVDAEVIARVLNRLERVHRRLYRR